MAKYVTVGSLMRNFLLQLFLSLALYYYCLLFLPHQHAVGPVPTFFPLTDTLQTTAMGE